MGFFNCFHSLKAWIHFGGERQMSQKCVKKTLNEHATKIRESGAEF